MPQRDTVAVGGEDRVSEQERETHQKKTEESKREDRRSGGTNEPGLASAKSSTSNMTVIWGDMVMVSPETRHSFLFSSSTVFMDSIHSASTGPSKTTHFLSGVVSDAALRKILQKRGPDRSHNQPERHEGRKKKSKKEEAQTLR